MRRIGDSSSRFVFDICREWSSDFCAAPPCGRRISATDCFYHLRRGRVAVAITARSRCGRRQLLRSVVVASACSLPIWLVRPLPICFNITVRFCALLLRAALRPDRFCPPSVLSSIALTDSVLPLSSGLTVASAACALCRVSSFLPSWCPAVSPGCLRPAAIADRYCCIDSYSAVGLSS